METLDELKLNCGAVFTVDQCDNGIKHVCVEVKVSDDQLIVMSLSDEEVLEVAKLLGSANNEKPIIN